MYMYIYIHIICIVCDALVSKWRALLALVWAHDVVKKVCPSECETTACRCRQNAYMCVYIYICMYTTVYTYIFISLTGRLLKLSIT